MAKPLMGLGDNRRCAPTADGGSSQSGLTIQGSVGRGGKNNPEDARRIQDALNRVPPFQGGPQPLLLVDGLVGPKTIGAITRFQSHHFGPANADGRVDPGHRTIAKLREFQSGPSAAAGAPTIPAGGPTTLGFRPSQRSSLVPVMTRVQAALPETLVWVNQALQRLAEAELKLKEAPGPDFTVSLQLVDRCFKVSSLGKDAALKSIGDIRAIFNTMREAIIISMKVTFFHDAPGGCNPPGKVINAFTYCGGFKKRDSNGLPPMSNPEFAGPNVPQNGIYMCTSHIANKTRDHLMDLMVHELAHFVGPAAGALMIEDHSGGLEALKSPHGIAIRTATNYAWLAWLSRLPRSQWLTNNG
jgi:hypothetical protein